MNRYSWPIPWMILISATSTYAYELATHARLTLEAFNNSTLQAEPSRLQDLGIRSLRYTLLGDTYFDIKGGIPRIRKATKFDYDLKKMPGAEGASGDINVPLRVSGWLMRGAVREDDSERLLGVGYFFMGGEQEPFDDPDLNFNRWCNHFYDPLSNKGLEDPHALPLCSIDRFGSAPTWASGAVDPFQTQPQEQSDRRNHFTIYDAREAMWRATTGYDRNQAQVASTGLQRKAYWATAFRSLGDILHLNQDMAQPQHTRNESHGLGDAAVYEKYINARARGDRYYVIDHTIVFPATMPALVDPSYAPPRFNRYSKYWSTEPGQGTFTGKGLADYSNRGFFTPSSNFNDGEYKKPSHDLNDYTPVTTSSVGALKEEYLTARVTDTYLGQSSDPIRMARRSVWDDGLGVPDATYSLDQATYDDRAALLLPRAVGYSAGLIDYFFNGRLAIGLPDAAAYAVADHSSASGFSKIRLKVTNTTPPLVEGGSNFPQHMLGGTAVAIVKFHRNKCYRNDLSGEYGAPSVTADSCRNRLDTQSNPPLDFDDSAEDIVVSKTQPLALSAGATAALDFDFSASPIPLDATDLYLQVAYRGSLGPDSQSAEQDAVVVGTKDISEPTYVSYFNASDYIQIGAKVYTRETVASDQALLAKVRPTDCVSGKVGSQQLRSDCLVPFDLTVKFSFTDLSTPVVAVGGLPSRRFVRFAFLTDPPAESQSEEKAKAGASSPMNLRIDQEDPGKHVAGITEKELLLQQGTCLPIDPIEIKPVRNQLQFEFDPPKFLDSGGALWQLRGIYGHTQIACVLNGDGSPPNMNDDRNDAMSALEVTKGETEPYALIVSPAFLAP